MINVVVNILIGTAVIALGLLAFVSLLGIFCLLFACVFNVMFTSSCIIFSKLDKLLDNITKEVLR